MKVQWDDNVMAVAIMMAPLFALLMVGCVMYPKRSLAGVVASVVIVLGWKILF